jgi:hypothetical protein
MAIIHTRAMCVLVKALYRFYILTLQYYIAVFNTEFNVFMYNSSVVFTDGSVNIYP